MKSKEIRKKFLEFFKSKGHDVVPSDSLVPQADPTLLFTSAGMNQFKKQFMGHNVTYKRATSSQKCLRTADLENVGKTAYHHTFFEMLGNFSFGDYFKKEAIEWGWEFMTSVLGIKKEKLWVSVYKDDKESYKIWRDGVKVPAKKIVKLGAKDNFWPSNAPKDGPNGPCGPCSEIFYDWGKGVGCKKKTCGPSCDCDRFVEVWNLVFTQFERKESGKLDPLPTQNIDTGMGLERIASVMQGVKTNFQTDLFKPIIKKIKESNESLKASDYCAIADHLRAAVFAICDGVAPSNEERGYVIRKLIRRAYIRGKSKTPFLYNVVPSIVEVMKDAYPELLQKREEISLVVKEEEERFAHTLFTAMPILLDMLEGIKGKTLDGESVFKLVDTYGLPLEVIEVETTKKKIKIDVKAFNELMDNRRKMSRKKSSIAVDIFALNLFAKAPKTEVSQDLPLKAKIAFMVNGKVAVKIAAKGDTVEIMTDPQSSSFYMESGGQVGDTGNIKTENGALNILNTVKMDKKVVHVAKITEGTVSCGDDATIELETDRKNRIAKNHTATHLLHSALKKVLGEHVRQAGSLVDETRLRFDFTHMRKLSDREIEKIEALVNDAIKKEIKIAKEEKTIDEAKAEGAVALFGEKYDKKVKVIRAGDFSKEVCGGTHVDNTRDIENFKIIREASVASGVRRIEALTSTALSEWIKEDEVAKKKHKKMEKEKEKTKELAKERLESATGGIDSLLQEAKDISGVKIIIKEIENANMGILRSLSDRIKSKTKSAFIFLESSDNGRINMVLTATKDLIQKGFDAGGVIKEAAKIVDGSGGGRPDFATAGGKNPAELSKVFEFIEKMASDIVQGA